MIKKINILLLSLIFGLGLSMKAQNVGFVINDGTDFLWVKSNYSLMNDTLITISLQRSADITKQLTVNLGLDVQTLSNKIAGAKSDLNPNIFKFAKLIHTQYVEYPPFAVFQPGQNKVDVTIKIRKNMLLEEWESEFET